MPDMLLSVLIAAGAVFYGLVASRSKTGLLRGLKRDLVAGRPRGYWVIAVLVGIVVLAKADYYWRMGPQ